MAGLALVKRASLSTSSLGLIKKDEIWDLLVSDGSVLHRAQVDDLAIYDEVTIVVHRLLTIRITGNRNRAQSQVL